MAVEIKSKSQLYVNHNSTDFHDAIQPLVKSFNILNHKIQKNLLNRYELAIDKCCNAYFYLYITKMQKHKEICVVI